MTFAQGVILNQSTVYNEYRAFSHDVPTMCSKTMTRGHVGVPNQPCGRRFSYVNVFFCSKKICKDAGHVNENAL